MTAKVTTSPFIPGWSSQPIPNFSLSASGLIVLADLSTIAQRTALRGGSSWLDSLLLAPGLHYQQAADELSRGKNSQILTAVELDREGKPTAHQIVNQAVVNYVLRVAEEGKTIVLDVGEVAPKKGSWGAGRKEKVRRGQRSMLYGGPAEVEESLSRAAQLLYVASPVLTCVAIALLVLLKDWWALVVIGVLMVSRILNITVIKSRSKPKPQNLPSPFPFAASLPPPPRMTQYTVTINPTTTVILRGLSSDLYALTTTIWLRPMSKMEGYLEAIAKVLVYFVAAIGGNATQAGNMVLLALLIISAGLLALSNAQQRGLRNGGRVVEPSTDETADTGYDRTWPLPSAAEHGAGGHGGSDGKEKNGRRNTTSWPQPSNLSSSGSDVAGVDGVLETGHLRVGTVRPPLPMDGSVEYEVRLETPAGTTIEVATLRAT